MSGGLSGQQIGLILSLTIITGVAGAMGAAWLGSRWGHMETALDRPGGHCDNHSSAEQQPRHTSILACHCRAYVSLNFWLAYMLGSATRVDISGRYAVLTTAALGGGAMIGPAISGLNFAAVDYAAGLG